MTTTSLVRFALTAALGCSTAAACARPAEPSAAVPAPANDAVPVSAQNQLVVNFVTPKPNSVGGTPERFEWTPVEGADNYTFGIWNETDQMVARSTNVRGTFVLWPKEQRLDPGTYYWSVAAFAGTEGIAASGLAAFVVQ